MKAIELSQHAIDQAGERGTSREEIELAIRTSEWQPARFGRWECRRDFEFNSVWNGKRYLTKQLRPVFVDEEERIVVVTIYVYYF